MRLARRIIPCLDVDGARVVKGVNFVGLRDAGDPAELAARYNAEGADELVVLDIAASRDRRPTFLETIRRVAERLAIPLTAGGGIRTLDDARAVVEAGADKVTVNTAAVERPELISELSQEFGAQAVVLAIDAKREGEHWDVRAGGNPFFIIETTGMLMPSHDGAGPGLRRVPPTVQAVVSARLDAMPGRLRELARRASVFIYAFDLGELAVVDPQATAEELQQLEDAEVIVRDPEPGRTQHWRLRFFMTACSQSGS